MTNEANSESLCKLIELAKQIEETFTISSEKDSF